MGSHFSLVERSIARLLGHFPSVKKRAKAGYSKAAYTIHRKGYRYCTRCQFDTYVKADDQESYFGYYDKSPVSSDGYALAHLSGRHTTEPPSPDRPVSLALVAPDGSLLAWLRVRAYNWQQGSRAHWLNDDLFMFNDFDDSGRKYISRVFSKKSLQETRRFDLPVQDSHGTDYFLSLDYRRLLALRPDYGYRNLSPLSKGELRDTSNDGIWRTEYATGETKLLYSLSQIAETGEKPEPGQGIHKVNHIMISPSGRQFIALHRCYQGRKRRDRLVLADAEGGGLRVIADYGMVSHCSWADEHTIVGYLRGPGSRDAYWIIDLQASRFTRFAQGALDKYGDGHPHVHGDWFVTDTYPDRARMQHLIMANWKTGEARKLGEFFHGFEYDGETRCDLHPRFSPDGKSIFFDSVFDGRRRLYRLDPRA